MAVDRAVEDEGRDEAVGAQPGNEGGGLPMAMRHTDPKATPTRRPP